MPGASFDTLKFSETLREAGMPESEAKAVAAAVRDAQLSGDLATNASLRDGLQVHGADLRTGMQALRAEIQTDMQTLRVELRTEMQALRTEFQTEMQALRTELQAEMQALRTGFQADRQTLRAEFCALEPRLTIRLGGILVIALGAFTALSKWIG